jgi:sec-independent protein translocase protein TatB
MFDIGWGEMVVIGVVALVAIGPKELPGVLRTAGKWVGKARRMAAEFQGQFNEALREAEMADLKKSFDEVADAARGLSGGNILSSMTKDVEDALKIDQPAATPPTPEPPAPETSVEAEAHTSEVPSAPEATPPLEIAPPVVPHDPPESGKAS